MTIPRPRRSYVRAATQTHPFSPSRCSSSVYRKLTIISRAMCWSAQSATPATTSPATGIVIYVCVTVVSISVAKEICIIAESFSFFWGEMVSIFEIGSIFSVMWSSNLTHVPPSIKTGCVKCQRKQLRQQLEPAVCWSSWFKQGAKIKPNLSKKTNVIKLWARKMICNDKHSKASVIENHVILMLTTESLEI